MGLDMVEMVMEIEDEFSVRVPDARLAEIRTVGDLCSLVASLLQQDGRPICRNVPAFCTIRRGFQELGLQREQIRTTTPLNSLLQMDSRREFWARLSAATGYQLPELERPPGLVWALVVLPVLALAGTLLECLTWPQAHGLVVGLFVILMGLPLYAILSARLTAPLATCFPHQCATVAGLVREVLRRNDVPLAEEPPHPPAASVFPRIRRIVSETLNIPQAEIFEDSRFLEDLRVD